MSVCLSVGETLLRREKKIEGEKTEEEEERRHALKSFSVDVVALGIEGPAVVFTEALIYQLQNTLGVGSEASQSNIHAKTDERGLGFSLIVLAPNKKKKT